MYNSVQSGFSSSSTGQAQSQTQAPNFQNSSNSSGSTALPPLVMNARLHELVIAGTGQNERLEPALEHVNRPNTFEFYVNLVCLGFE